ncbi:MFS transporter [Mycobacterium kyogaense]|uniref:MFS transporter n=1 Tax=Mycobacterium kyogaense TaxID=2212479 RepID=UPI0013C4F930|nr:MFS transporter [Mycobacterium kyogaense]
MPASPAQPDPQAEVSTSWRTGGAVAALALAVFTVTVAEMMPIGLLIPIGRELKVSHGAVGLSVTMYGLLAGLAAPKLTAWTYRIDRRILVLSILAVFVAGNLATAMVATYPQLLTVRLAMGLAHGLMWAIVASVAVRVAPTSPAVATAATFSGISLALVLGVPAGTYLGAWLGWRASFLTLAALTVVAWIAVVLALPELPQHNPAHQQRWRALLTPSLRATLAVTALVVIANYAAYTYIAPFLIDRLAIATAEIGGYLLIYGVAGVLGNVVAGVVLSRAKSPRRVLLGATAALTTALVALTLPKGFETWLAGTWIALWGLTYSALPVILQTNVFHSVTPQARESATSLYVLAFNTSIAAGALAGALAIDKVSTTAPMLIGALLCATATAVTLASTPAASTPK